MKMSIRLRWGTRLR